MSPIAIAVGRTFVACSIRGDRAPEPSLNNADIEDVRVTRDAFHVSSLPALSEKRRMSTAWELSGEFCIR